MFLLVLPLSTAFVPIMVVSFSGFIYGVMIAMLSFLTSLYIWRKAAYGRNDLYLYLINFIFMYFMIVLGGLFYGWFLEYKLAQFDLNGDTIFSIEEQTPEQIRYMELLVNDIGRNLLFFTGIFYSLLGTLMLSSLRLLYKVFIKRESRDKVIK